MTVMVYICLPELNNQHGRVLIGYLVCLFTGYSMLATMKMLLYFDRSTKTMCFGLSKYLFDKYVQFFKVLPHNRTASNYIGADLSSIPTLDTR